MGKFFVKELARAPTLVVFFFFLNVFSMTVLDTWLTATLTLSFTTHNSTTRQHTRVNGLCSVVKTGLISNQTMITPTLPALISSVGRLVLA